MEKLKQIYYRARYHGPFQDWKVNKGNFKGRIVLFLFRIASFVRKNPVLTVLFIWYLALYRIIIEWIFNIEINWHVRAGKSLKLNHGHGSVIEASTVFGNNCTIRHLTTISNKLLPDGTYSLSPRIGNNVDIGVNAIIIGDIEIGDNAIIGAGAVVTKSVPPNCVVVGNPARLLKKVYSQHSIN